MPVRLALAMMLALALAGNSARAQDLFAPAPPPSEIARAQAGDPPVDRLPPPRVLDDAPDPKIVDPELIDPLEESYAGIDPILPNRFGSRPNQRTWGTAGARYVFGGDKMGPNGVQYNPFLSLDLNFNFALTRSRHLYIFADARCWGQGDSTGAPNDSNYNERQFDLSGGIAWNFYGRFEGRFFAYSSNNLNRGTSLAAPFGSNNGTALEGRYYFAGTDFDQGIFNFISIGYYMSNTMIGNDGQQWDPGAFLRWSYNIPLWKQHLYLYTIGEFITERPSEAKWLWLDTGFSCRPIPHYPMLDLRLGNESNVDIVSGRTLSIWYVGARFAW